MGSLLRYSNFFYLIFLIVCSCIDPYEPVVLKSPNQFLVVNGFINTGPGPTTIRLSRTQNLADTATNSLAEPKALVIIQGELGSRHVLSESTGGIYSAENLNLDATSKYRLAIKTADGKEYASDYVTVKQTPEIDSVSWKAGNDGLQIYVNTHDAQNNTRYYRWEYEETWEFVSAFYSDIDFKDKKVVKRTENIYRCWNTILSTEIKVGNTVKLSRDVVSEFPITLIPANSGKLQYRYSILVKQYGQSQEAYDYWEAVKKNNENIGTIFGPQPTRLAGNIHCLTDPKEPIVGYITAGPVKEKRIFITRKDLPTSWNTFVSGYENCSSDTIKWRRSSPPNFNLEVAAEKMFSRGESLLFDVERLGSIITGYVYSSADCVDCRKRGTNIKPAFW